MCYNDDDDYGDKNNNNKPNLSTFQMVHHYYYYYYNSFQWRKLTKGKHIDKCREISFMCVRMFVISTLNILFLLKMYDKRLAI